LQPQKTKYSFLIVIAAVGAGMAFAGLVIVGWAASNAYNFLYRLDHHKVTATAQVDDWQTVTRAKAGKTYELKYHFAVPGSNKTYTAQDDFLIASQKDTWVTVDEDDWERTRDTGTVKIEYLRGHPDVNQAVIAKHGYGSTILFSILGLVMLGIGALLLRGGIRQILKQYREVPALFDSTATPGVSNG
jgi:hypothetical protein